MRTKLVHRMAVVLLAAAGIATAAGTMAGPPAGNAHAGSRGGHCPPKEYCPIPMNRAGSEPSGPDVVIHNNGAKPGIGSGCSPCAAGSGGGDPSIATGPGPASGPAHTR